MQVSIALLIDPTSSADGKFYIAVEDPKSPFALYGPNRPNVSGTKTLKNSVGEIKTLVRGKLRKGYLPCASHEIPKAALTEMLRLIAQNNGIADPNSLSIQGTTSNWYVTLSKSTPQTAQAGRKPKIKKVSYNIWI